MGRIVKPAEFAKRRDRIMHCSAGRSNDWRKRAMKRLAKEAGTTADKTAGGRVLSWRLRNGQHVCVKHRYPDEQFATTAIDQIQREPDGRRKPIRAYACSFCFGWHITSQPK
ncbi:hypothetical protein [Bradyrhizobium sp. BWC-3-1]|uniref:hypothetical protein n=1 Tax=Bradyrhizobium sp. BWC-3-1 TaxID=3080012 RepID=UPI00293F1CB6|nr:hypothetical protein [Bradyrhizobium sp. BWC-3-1]WOH61937.1 hypothetical protein RX329_18320 [Bradyrhizobium sp. BWC-3-1]